MLCWRVRRLQRWAWERVGRGKRLLLCRLLGGARRFGAQGEERGGGIPWRPPAYSLVITHIYRLLNLRSTVIVCVFWDCFRTHDESVYHCRYCNGKIPSKNSWIGIQNSRRLTSKPNRLVSVDYVQPFHKIHKDLTDRSCQQTDIQTQVKR